MDNPAEQEQDKPSRSRHKKFFTLLKVFLAFAILFMILYKVKVRDHLTLPQDCPFPGQFVGMFEINQSDSAFEEIRFTQEGRFHFTAKRQTDGKIIHAEHATNDGKQAYVYSKSQMEEIVLREGLLSVLKTSNPWTWPLSMVIYFTALFITTIRWGIILRATDLPQSWARAFKLTFMGFFFNNVVPGQTGGDLIRAYYIAKENNKRKTDSIITVFVDRALGITALAVIAAIVIPTDFERYGKYAYVIYLFFGMVCIATLFFSRRIRRFFRIADLLKKLPFQELLQNMDRSIFLYRGKKVQISICFLMSFVVHLIIILSLWVLGCGIGIDLKIWSYMAYIPLIFIISSIPLTPAGWGVGELLFVVFFGLGGVPSAKALALSLLFRLSAALISLLGGVFLFMEKTSKRSPSK